MKEFAMKQECNRASSKYIHSYCENSSLAVPYCLSADFTKPLIWSKTPPIPQSKRSSDLLAIKNKDAQTIAADIVY